MYMAAMEFSTIPGITHYQLLAEKSISAPNILREVPYTITFFRPYLSVINPPGSWKRKLPDICIIDKSPTITMGVLRTSTRYRLHHRFHRLLNTLYNMFVNDIAITFLFENTSLIIDVIGTLFSYLLFNKEG